MQFGMKLYPTNFAIQIANAVGLYDGDPLQNGCRIQKKRIEDFEKMSISLDYQTCVETVYYGVELDEDQRDALKLIHEKSGLWAKSEIINELYRKIEGKDVKGKDAAEIGRILLEFLNSDDDGSGKGKPKLPVSKSMLVRLANLPPNTVIPGMAKDEPEDEQE